MLSVATAPKVVDFVDKRMTVSKSTLGRALKRSARCSTHVGDGFDLVGGDLVVGKT